MASENTLVVGSVTSGGSVYQPWPDYWTWPTSTYVYTQPPTVDRSDEYANEVEVVRGEHDATLHFYRSSGPNKGRTFIKTITIPLGCELLDAFGQVRTPDPDLLGVEGSVMPTEACHATAHPCPAAIVPDSTLKANVYTWPELAT